MAFQILQYIPKGKRRKAKRRHEGHKIIEFAVDSDYILDKYTLYRGVFQHKYDFVVILLLASIGLGNVVNFPKLVYRNGGAVFIIFYVFLSIAFGIPLFIIESGLSQFYSTGESRLFRIVPYFSGLGWSIHMLNLILFIPYSISIEWYAHYLIYAFLPGKAPWEYCFDIPSVICVEINTMLNRSLEVTEMSPTLMFFEFEVMGTRNVNDGLLYTFDNALEGIRRIQFILIVSVWVAIAIFTWFLTKMYIKFGSFLLILSGSILILLTLKSLFLTGSFKGLHAFLDPNLEKLFTGKCLKSAVSQVIFSLIITKSCSSFASLNSFKFDFFRASLLIVLGDFSFSVISGILVFSKLGFLATKLNTDIDNLLKKDITFVNFLDASVINNEFKFWIFIFMLMMIILGISSLSAICSAFAISFIDFFPLLMNRSEFKKWLVCLIICTTLGSVSLFFSLNGSVLYHNMFTKTMDEISTPLMILSEVVLVQFVYGAKRLRMEIKMMIGYTYNFIWFFFSITVVPTLIIFILFYEIYTHHLLNAPFWANALANVISFLPLVPLVFSFLSQLITNFRKEKGIDIIKVGLRTSKIYGPYYKKNWLLSKYYQRKLVLVRKNPEFLKTIRETENLQDVLDCLRRMYIKVNTVPSQQSNDPLRMPEIEESQSQSISSEENKNQKYPHLEKSQSFHDE